MQCETETRAVGMARARRGRTLQEVNCRDQGGWYGEGTQGQNLAGSELHINGGHSVNGLQSVPTDLKERELDTGDESHKIVASGG
jgi:hypothetical protein